MFLILSYLYSKSVSAVWACGGWPAGVILAAPVRSPAGRCRPQRSAGAPGRASCSHRHGGSGSASQEPRMGNLKLSLALHRS